MENVQISWRHDEYMYHLTRDNLPEPALYMIRYHSFYSQHLERAHDHLLNEHDQKMFKSMFKN